MSHRLPGGTHLCTLLDTHCCSLIHHIIACCTDADAPGARREGLGGELLILPGKAGKAGNTSQDAQQDDEEPERHISKNERRKLQQIARKKALRENLSQARHQSPPSMLHAAGYAPAGHAPAAAAAAAAQHLPPPRRHCPPTAASSLMYLRKLLSQLGHACLTQGSPTSITR